MPIRRRGPELPQVDREAIFEKEFEELQPHEKRWLQDSDYWPQGMDHERQAVTFRMPDGTEISNDPTWVMGEGAMQNPAIQAAIEARAQELARQLAGVEMQGAQAVQGEYSGNATGRFPAGQDHTGQAGVGEGSDAQEDENLPYPQMGVQELRALALERGLPIDGLNGKKTGDGVMIANLERWDREHPDDPSVRPDSFKEGEEE
jgi:hypothetical protein